MPHDAPPRLDNLKYLGTFTIRVTRTCLGRVEVCQLLIHERAKERGADAHVQARHAHLRMTRPKRSSSQSILTVGVMATVAAVSNCKGKAHGCWQC